MDLPSTGKASPCVGKRVLPRVQGERQQVQDSLTPTAFPMNFGKTLAHLARLDSEFNDAQYTA